MKSDTPKREIPMKKFHGEHFTCFVAFQDLLKTWSQIGASLQTIIEEGS